MVLTLLQVDKEPVTEGSRLFLVGVARTAEAACGPEGDERFPNPLVLTLLQVDKEPVTEGSRLFLVGVARTAEAACGPEGDSS